MTKGLPLAPDRLTPIDIFRGLAALAVLFFHARSILWVGLSEWMKAGELKRHSLDTIIGLLSFPLRYGWWGVPLFFVISGYCIHRPEVRRRRADPASRLQLGKYAARRIWRIYPVLLAALLLTAGLDRVTHALLPLEPQTNESWFCFAANLVSLQNIVAPTYGTNYPLWTLAIEIHFYVVYPLLLVALTRLGVTACTAIVLGLSMGSWLLLQWSGKELVYFLPYWFPWVVGAYVAEAEAGFVHFPRKLMAAITLPCLAAALTIDRWQDLCVASTPVVYTLLAAPFALLLWYAVSYPRARIWNSLLCRATAFIGLFSYSLYATHVPVLMAYKAVFQSGQPSMVFLAVIPGTIMAVAVAYVMYLMVEQWTLKLPGQTSREYVRVGG